MNIRVLPTAGLSDSDRIALRRLFDAAYDGDFTDDDFDHALGGWHAIAGNLAAPIAHAAVVARSLFIDTRELRTGFVEAVATLPTHQRTGLGSRVMAAIADLIRDRFELGALSSGEHEADHANSFGVDIDAMANHENSIHNTRSDNLMRRLNLQPAV